MAEPTATRAAIRQAIGRLARMPFYLRYGSGSIVLGSTEQTVTQLAAAELTQPEKFWQAQYAWIVESSAERRVTEYDVGSTAGLLSLEYALSAAAASSDSIEITSIWPPTQIHEAINAAIASASKHYPDVVTDESLVLEENKMVYSLSGLTSTPWQILQVYVEQPASSITGQPTAATGTTITDAAQDFSTNDTDHFVSVYAGTGSGQLRETSTGSSGGQLTVATWTTTPDTTSFYRYWDAGDQQIDWYRVHDVNFDNVEYPDNLYFSELYSGSYGARIRLKYLSNNNSLAADSDVTTVPVLYISHKVLSLLHDSLIGDNRVDRSVHASLAEYYDSLAEKYLVQTPRRRPAGTLWRGEASGAQSTRNDSIGDPLKWRGG